MRPNHAAGPTVAITGVGGYLGSCVAGHFVAAGWRILALGRRPAADQSSVPFRLGDEISPEPLRGAQALVHCAYDFSVIRPAEVMRVNVEGTRKLFAAARLAGIPRLVCVSSISAFDGCRSVYGQAKLAIEEIARLSGALTVRPGLIWGDPPGGTFGRLVEQVTGARVVPLIGDGSQIQFLVHRDDLADLIVRYCTDSMPPPSAPLTVAHARPWPFRELLRAIAEPGGRSPIFLPLPWRLIWGGLRAAEWLRLPLNFRSDSVVSLMNQNPASDLTGAERLGITCRAFR